MVFSYLKVAFNIPLTNIHIYEDDSGIDLADMEDRILTLREETLKLAPSLKEVASVFKKGNSN